MTDPNISWNNVRLTRIQEEVHEKLQEQDCVYVKMSRRSGKSFLLAYEAALALRDNKCVLVKSCSMAMLKSVLTPMEQMMGGREVIENHTRRGQLARGSSLLMDRNDSCSEYGRFFDLILVDEYCRNLRATPIRHGSRILGVGTDCVTDQSFTRGEKPRINCYDEVSAIAQAEWSLLLNHNRNHPMNPLPMTPEAIATAVKRQMARNGILS